MRFTWDEAKRLETLGERGLDFRDAPRVFAEDYLEFLDDRKDYGEVRYIIFGFLEGRRVSIVWTPRGDARRIISMRHAHDEEFEARRRTLD
jgi:uncharacterized DUF497 family protein